MRTKPIKWLSSVSKVNMGGIKNFPSAVITPITLPIADSTVICLVQSCFSVLPGLMCFVYADCSFEELRSLFFDLCFLSPWAQLRAQNSPLLLSFPARAGCLHRLMNFLSARDAAVAPKYSMYAIWTSPSSSSTELKKKKYLPRQ